MRGSDFLNLLDGIMRFDELQRGKPILLITCVSVGRASTFGNTVVLGGYLQDLVPPPLQLRQDVVEGCRNNTY